MDPIAIMDNAISNVRTTLEFHKAGYEQLHRAFASRVTRSPEYSPDAMAQEVRGLEKAKAQVERDQMLLENLTAIKAKMVEAMQQENGEGKGCVNIGPFIRVDPETVKLIPSEPVPKKPNTKFSFLYRDGSNYKTYNVFVLAGCLTEEQIREILACGDGDDFIAEQVGLSHEFPGVPCDDDGPWCEFIADSFEPTELTPTTELTAQQLLENFRAAKGKWDEVTYDPNDIYC